MWYTADLAHKKHDLYAYGLDKEPESIKYGDFDWAKLKHKRDAYVTRLNGIYENNLKREKSITHMDLLNLSILKVKLKSHYWVIKNCHSWTKGKLIKR